MEMAKAQGFATLSLSVNPDNPAMQLYERLGFEKVALVEGSWTMLASLARKKPPPDRKPNHLAIRARPCHRLGQG